MIYSVEITNTADLDLRRIFEYIAYTLHSFQNAIAQIYRLEKSIATLNNMPQRFRQHDKEPWHSRNLRIMPVDNFLVFYIANEKYATVTIIRILYGGQDKDIQLM